MSLLTVFGGPGCGKTTRLLAIVEAELAAGVPANQICYTTFTVKAAEEARTRAAAKFGLDPKTDLRWFSTLHSLAFRSLGLNAGEVMQGAHYAQVAETIGQRVTTGRVDEDLGMWNGPLPGDRCIFVEQLARSRMVPIDVVANEYHDVWDARLWANTVALWKRSNQMIDYTDMLEMAIAQKSVPSFRVLVIDEAQDLSPLQWALVREMAASAERVYIGGDDDQAIYQWSGADVAQFLAVAAKGEIQVLDKSHRLPRTVFDAAGRILSRIVQRQPKQWEPAREGGDVQQYFTFADAMANLAPSNGSWYMLARNKLYLEHFRHYFYEHGIPFLMNGHSSLDNNDVRAARVWTTLQRGGEVDGNEVRLVFSKLGSGMVNDMQRRVKVSNGTKYDMKALLARGVLHPETDWQRALDIDPRSKHYIRMVQQNGLKLTVAPWITISTVHQVKGGEADNVWLESNMTRRSHDGLRDDPDSEHRVFYVGASRAKKNLYVGARSSTYGYRDFVTTGVAL